MKKLTAVSMFCNGKKIVKFLMLDTINMVRGGKRDVKTTMTSKQFSDISAECASERGDTVSFG